MGEYVRFVLSERLRVHVFGGLAAIIPVLVSLAAGVGAATAQSRSLENGVPSWDLTGGARQPVFPQDRTSREATPRDRGSMTADEALFRDAEDDIKAGQTASAARMLELLVARYPDSPWAMRARRQLVSMYSGGGQATGQVAELGPAQRPGLRFDGINRLGGPRPADSPAQSRDSTRGTGDAWSTKVTAQPSAGERLQDALRDAAGDRVFFGQGSGELGALARKALTEQAKFIKAGGPVSVVIEGYADEPGSAAVNLALSVERAERVSRALVTAGVSANQIKVIAFGNARPVATCSAPACAAQNRRVVTRLMPLPDAPSWGTSVPMGLGLRQDR